jgi:hypothetical protein
MMMMMMMIMKTMMIMMIKINMKLKIKQNTRIFKINSTELDLTHVLVVFRN